MSVFSCFFPLSSLIAAGFVFVSVPAPKGEKYAFSVPLSGVYSILVYAVSLDG